METKTINNVSVLKQPSFTALHVPEVLILLKFSRRAVAFNLSYNSLFSKEIKTKLELFKFSESKSIVFHSDEMIKIFRNVACIEVK